MLCGQANSTEHHRRTEAKSPDFVGARKRLKRERGEWKIEDDT
jgi:hypothetical protein